MTLSEISQRIGQKVHMNGKGDLAMRAPYRKYLYPSPDITPVFFIIKVTRCGRVQIQAENGELLNVSADNVDLIESGNNDEA